MFRQFADEAGLPVPCTCTRCGTRPRRSLAAAGVPASDIAAQLGHADGGALALRAYVHPLEENRRRAAAHLDDVIGGAE